MNSEPDGRQIWVADSETDPFEFGTVPHPFIWGIYHGYADTFYREFSGSGPGGACTRGDIDLLVDFLSEQEIILYAHNGGKFDWHFISHRFQPGDDILIIHGRLARFQIGKCEFRDSYNLLPVALEQYQKQKIDYTKMSKEHRANHMPEIRDYLKSDCVNLWNMVHGFIKEYGLHITQASAAMHFWNRQLGNKIYRSGPTHYDHFKKYYYGGRVQCFEQGDFVIEAKSIDIKSAYPEAMMHKHPYGLKYIEHDGKPRCHPKYWGPMFFTVQCIAHGCFPYRGINGSLYFPDDDEPRVYDVTGWELIAAVETETIEQIKFISHIEFDVLEDFSEYILYFWNMRKEYRKRGDDGAVFYTKIFMNALYGKFGTDPRRFRQYILRRGDEIGEILKKLVPGDSFKAFREWIIVSKEQEQKGNTGFYNLATSASITGYVRAKFWRAVCDCERPLYGDTDSITAVRFGASIKIGEELGEWSIEHEYNRIVICGKKLYACHKTDESFRLEKSKAKYPETVKRWKLASKGARLTADEIIKIAAGQLIEYKNIVPTFSTAKSKPTFITRHMKMTAGDIRIIPRHVDPKFTES